MNRRRIYIVVNEGASERTYLQSLRSFLANRMPLGDDFCPRLDLIPRVTNGGIGGGAFPLVRKTYRMCRQADRHTPIVIWVDADIYVYAHATAPFVTVDTIHECVAAVKSGEYDSAFCAVRIQDYLWSDGQPMNFDAQNLPRSQDIKPIFRETSGIYVIPKDMYKKLGRRIGLKPYIKEVSFKESVDINNPEDFELAQALLNIDL